MKNSLSKLSLFALFALPASFVEAAPAVDLLNAITKAERHVGGTATEASLEDDFRSLSYEVSVVKDGRIYDVWVDANNGGILGQRLTRDVSDVALVSRATLSLSEAVSAALSAQQGTAVDAEIDLHRRRVSYEVTIMTANGREFDLRIDAVSGAVISHREDLRD